MVPALKRQALGRGELLAMLIESDDRAMLLFHGPFNSPLSRSFLPVRDTTIKGLELNSWPAMIHCHLSADDHRRCLITGLVHQNRFTILKPNNPGANSNLEIYYLGCEAEKAIA